MRNKMARQFSWLSAGQLCQSEEPMDPQSPGSMLRVVAEFAVMASLGSHRLAWRIVIPEECLDASRARSSAIPLAQ